MVPRVMQGPPERCRRRARVETDGRPPAQERRDDAGRAASRPAYGVLRLREASAAGSTAQRPRRVDEREVGRLPDGDRPAVAAEPADAARADAHPVGDAGPVEQAGLDHRLGDDADRGLEAEHAEGGAVPLAVLVLRGVRRVVGGDRVDRAVGERLAQRLDVLGGAQRRVDLVDRVVAWSPARR